MSQTLPPTDPLDVPADQTQFDTDAWLYDANKPQKVKATPQKWGEYFSFWKTRQGILILIPLALVSILVIMAAAMMAIRNGQVAPAPDPTNTTVQNTIDLGPLGDKVKLLSQELKAADPTKELDPFPPVRLDLRLDEAKN